MNETKVFRYDLLVRSTSFIKRGGL